MTGVGYLSARHATACVLPVLLLAARPCGALTPLPGVVFDPARAVVYLMAPGGGIDALRLARGEVLWKTARAAKPLVVAGERLLAQADPPGDGILRLVVLDAREGKRLLDVDVGLPRGVWASVDEGPGTSFTVRARTEGDGALVSWRSVERPVSGLSPEPGGARAPRVEEGAARIDLRTGHTEPHPPIPEAPARPRTARVRRDGKECVVLRREPPGADITLACGEPVAQLESADGRHVLVALQAEGERRVHGDYVWSIHSLDTGERLTELASESSALPFFVWDSCLVYEVRPSVRMLDGATVVTRRALRAVDIVSGALLWSRLLRDPAYRGPYPSR